MTDDKELRQAVGVRLKPSTVTIIDRLAKRLHITRSKWIEQAVEERVAQEEPPTAQ